MSEENLSMNVPAHIAKRIADRKGSDNKKSSVMSAIVQSDGFAFPRISTRASRYRLVEDGVETVVGITLDVVIIGANPKVSKVFYGKPYDPNATDMRPDCYSDDGIRPDSSVTAPVHDNCATCPHNVLGSKITPSGAKSKLCADQRHLAVVAAADPSGKVYALTIPVSGMKALREYFKELNNYGIMPEEVVTQLGFDEDATFPKITFKRKAFVPEKAIPKIEAMAETDMVKAVVKVLPMSAVAGLEGPSNAGAITHEAEEAPAPAPKADPEADAYEEEEAAPAPKPKVAKPKPTPVEPDPEPVEEAAEDVSDIEKALDSMFDE